MTVLDYRSGIEELSDASRGRTRSWLGWAIYLGMSWTWCIGMFLPVILVRDYGVWAWVIFAIPNVIGAAAMGWVLKDHDSQAIVAAHGLAIKAFSLATAAFQLFFALWMFEDHGATGSVWATILLALVVLRASRREQDVVSIAGIVFMASLVTVLFGALQNGLGMPAPATVKEGNVLDLVALTPVCFLGFLLCPYLDVTFHRARQQLVDHQAKAAFSIGFGFFFLLMIVYTLLYARLFQYRASGALIAGVIGHWIVQLGLTAGLHWHGLPRQGERDPQPVVWGRIAVSVLIATSAWVATVAGSHPIEGETIYRCFMGFYGLVFPAYVWLCMVPGRGARLPTHRQWSIAGGTVLVALPFYWLGFVQGKMIWLLPGVAIVLLARLLIKPSHLPDISLMSDELNGQP
jgi:hypothetical protein